MHIDIGPPVQTHRHSGRNSYPPMRHRRIPWVNQMPLKNHSVGADLCVRPRISTYQAVWGRTHRSAPTNSRTHAGRHRSALQTHGHMHTDIGPAAQTLEHTRTDIGPPPHKPLGTTVETWVRLPMQARDHGPAWKNHFSGLKWHDREGLISFHAIRLSSEVISYGQPGSELSPEDPGATRWARFWKCAAFP